MREALNEIRKLVEYGRQNDDPSVYEPAEAALTLLTEEEPRVLLLEEVKRLEEGADVFIDGGDFRTMATVGGVGASCIWFVCGVGYGFQTYGKDYGWRLWTARPGR